MVAEQADEYCIACHHCIAACPVNAISIDGIDSTKCQDFVKETHPRFEHIAALVRTRRSIRHYADKPLPDRTVEQLLDVVRWVPTAKNALPVKWLVCNSKDKVHELAGIVIQWLSEQPGGETLKKQWEKGIDPVFRGAPCVVAAYTQSDALWPAVDTAIAVETLDLCAAAMRLGSCWAGYFIRAAQNEPAINQFLGLQKDETIYGGLMLGYAGDETYRKIPYRPELQLRWLC
jgi:nitroreductase